MRIDEADHESESFKQRVQKLLAEKNSLEDEVRTTQ
jgi:hypothetical protein